MSKRGRDSAMQGQEYATNTDTESLAGWAGNQGSGLAAAAAAAAAGDNGAPAVQHALLMPRDPAEADESEYSSDNPAEADESESSSDEEDVKPARKKAARGSSSAKAAPNKKGTKKKQPKEPKQGPRIGAKKANKVYSLDDSDLAKMKDTKYTFSPLCGGHRMYSPKELEEYARAKHAGNERFERTLKDHFQAEERKKQRRRGHRAEETAAALQAVTKYAAPNKAIEVEQYGETKLPDIVLVKIMELLAKTREPGGLRGFACVAKDLASASLANWDLYRAAKTGFSLLSEEAKALPDPPAYWSHYRTSWTVRFRYGGHLRNLPGAASLGGWEFWEGFLADPLKPTVAKLKAACELVGITAKGTKAQMALRLLEVFGLKAATTVPAQLLRVVRLERFRSIKALPWDGPDAAALHDRVSTAIDQMIQADEDNWKHLQRAPQDGSRRGIAAIRATIRQRYSSIEEFLEAAKAADEERECRESEAANAAERQRKESEAAAVAAAAGGGSASNGPVQPPPPAAAAAAAKPMSRFAAMMLLESNWELDDYFMDDDDPEGF